MKHKQILPLILALGAAPLWLGAQTNRDAPDGSRGEYLFTEGYKCFACHGYDGQSGARRLVPMRFDVAGFTALVRNSPFQQMPSYNDVPPEDLAAIFAYIQSIPQDAPAVESVELLSEIAARQRAAAD